MANNYEETNERDSSVKEEQKNGKGRKRSNFRNKKKGGDKPSRSVSGYKRVHNDFKWYLSGPIGPAAFDVPFAEQAGSQVAIPNDGQFGGSVVPTATTFRLPGVLTIPVAPAVGQATSTWDPINLAYFKLHTALRYGQSYSGTYDAAHLGMYTVAADSAAMLLEYWKRLYGLLRYYSAFDLYIPRFVFRALGVDYADFQANMQSVLVQINHYVDIMNQLKMPNTWPIFDRHEFMFKSWYVDSVNTSRPQHYFFVPAFFYKYSVSSTPGVFGCYPKAFGGTNHPYTFTELMAYSDEIFNAFVQDDSLSRISSDFIRYFGSKGCRTWSYIDPTYAIAPLYDLTIMQQIHNMKPILAQFNELSPEDQNNFVISQNLATGAINCTPVIHLSDSAAIQKNSVFCFGAVLDVDSAAPGPELVAEATRMMHTCSFVYDGTTATLGVYGASTEFVFEPTIWTMTDDFTVEQTRSHTVPTVAATAITTYISRLDKFSHHPIVYYMRSNAAAPEIRCILGDVNSWTTLSNRQIVRMNDEAMKSCYQLKVLEEAKPLFK